MEAPRVRFKAFADLEIQHSQGLNCTEFSNAMQGQGKKRKQNAVLGKSTALN
jgi:hypothetical protein